MIWFPATGPLDLVGNPLTDTTPVTETGGTDSDF
jgi:hypothetical protein